MREGQVPQSSTDGSTLGSNYHVTSTLHEPVIRSQQVENQTRELFIYKTLQLYFALAIDDTWIQVASHPPSGLPCASLWPLSPLHALGSVGSS